MTKPAIKPPPSEDDDSVVTDMTAILSRSSGQAAETVPEPSLEAPAEPEDERSAAYSDTAPETFRPHLLDSVSVEDDLRRRNNAARARIDAIDRELLAIDIEADRQISDINARRDAERKSRQYTRDDLTKVVEMTNAALGIEGGAA